MDHSQTNFAIWRIATLGGALIATLSSIWLTWPQNTPISMDSYSILLSNHPDFIIFLLLLFVLLGMFILLFVKYSFLRTQYNLVQDSLQQKQDLCTQTHQELNRVLVQNDILLHELKSAQKDTELAKQTKSHFLHKISHELRTPLHHIIGLVEVVQSKEKDPELAEFLHLTAESANQLLRLINEIINYSEAVQLRPQKQKSSFQIKTLLETLLSKYEGVSKNKGIDLSLNLDPTLPREMIGEPQILSQILDCLLNNSVKFTQKGSIHINVENLTTEGNRLFLQIAIADTGIGIDWNTKEMIFESFSQAETSLNRQYGGLGLGLTLAKTLVDRLEGVLWFQSQLDSGTVFYLNLALECASQQLRPEHAYFQNKPMFPNLRLLLVEDVPFNQKITTQLLNHCGIAVDVAENGFQALKLLRQKEYDILLMDLEMPLMDGLETTRRIRKGEAGEKAQALPIIGLTDYGYPEEITNCMNAGMNQYLSRPIKKNILTDLILQLTSGQQETKQKA